MEAIFYAFVVSDKFIILFSPNIHVWHEHKKLLEFNP